MTSNEHIRKVVESFYGDIWNNHDKSKIPELLSPEINFRGSLGPAKSGHDGFASYVDFVYETFAEYHCDILDLVVEEPKAFARMFFSGIHRGEFFGYPASGKPLSWAGSALFIFKDGQIADLWVLGDTHGLLQQLERNAIR